MARTRLGKSTARGSESASQARIGLKATEWRDSGQHGNSLAIQLHSAEATDSVQDGGPDSSCGLVEHGLQCKCQDPMRKQHCPLHVG